MYSALITAISNILSKLFEFKTAQVENLAQTDVIEDKKDYKKAIDIAEKIIDIAEKYKTEMTFAHRLRFAHLVQDFKKHN